jgi:hypothetical protein
MFDVGGSDAGKTMVAWIESFSATKYRNSLKKCYIYYSHSYCPKEEHPGKLSIHLQKCQHTLHAKAK